MPGDCDHTGCDGFCWKGYPQSRFPNWTHRQVRKSKLRDAIEKYNFHGKRCIIYKLDVDKMGIFHDAGYTIVLDSNEELNNEWNRLVDDNVC